MSLFSHLPPQVECPTVTRGEMGSELVLSSRKQTQCITQETLKVSRNLVNFYWWDMVVTVYGRGRIETQPTVQSGRGVP